MKKTYYLFNPGRMSRRDNTLTLSTNWAMNKSHAICR